MEYTIKLNENERNLLLQTTTELMTDKEFYDRELAGQIFYKIVYAERTNSTDGKHFTED